MEMIGVGLRTRVRTERRLPGLVRIWVRLGLWLGHRRKLSFRIRLRVRVRIRVRVR